MIEGGVEYFLGAKTDKSLRPIATLGLGGVRLYRSTPSSTHNDALEMTMELRGRWLRSGSRGNASLGRENLIETIVRPNHLVAWAGRRLRELDINPLTVLPRGTVALDTGTYFDEAERADG
jgi:hypothetical protein